MNWEILKKQYPQFSGYIAQCRYYGESPEFAEACLQEMQADVNAKAQARAEAEEDAYFSQLEKRA